jgi:hypothetical protein
MYVDALLLPSRFKAKGQIGTRPPKRPWGTRRRLIGAFHWWRLPGSRDEKSLSWTSYEVLRGMSAKRGAAGVLSCKARKGNSFMGVGQPSRDLSIGRDSQGSSGARRGHRV